jgi:hypothetical protein
MSDYWFLSHKFIYISKSCISPHQKLSLASLHALPKRASLPAKKTKSTFSWSLPVTCVPFWSFFPFVSPVPPASTPQVLSLPARQHQRVHFFLFAVFSEFLKVGLMACAHGLSVWEVQGTSPEEDSAKCCIYACRCGFIWRSEMRR